MASLGCVTPEAATEGVTPLFFPEKPGDLFLVASSALSPLTTFSCSSLYRFLLLSLGCLGCHPLQGVTPHLFYLSDLISPLFFVNLPTKIFFPSGVTPLEGVTDGGPPPLTPPSDATGCKVSSKHNNRLECHRTQINILFWELGA